MKNNMGGVYENITVLAVHILNADEIPFERCCKSLVEQYQRFLLECSDIMWRGGRCFDVLLDGNYIYGIFGGCGPETEKRAVEVAVKIEELVKKINEKNCIEHMEKWTIGMGIAEGTAITFSVGHSVYEGGKRVWLGPVLKRASSLAGIALRNGQRSVIVANRTIK